MQPPAGYSREHGPADAGKQTHGPRAARPRVANLRRCRCGYRAGGYVRRPGLSESQGRMTAADRGRRERCSPTPAAAATARQTPWRTRTGRGQDRIKPTCNSAALTGCDGPQAATGSFMALVLLCPMAGTGSSFSGSRAGVSLPLPALDGYSGPVTRNARSRAVT